MKTAESELSMIFSVSTLTTVILYLPAAKIGMETTVLSVIVLKTTVPSASKIVRVTAVKFSTSNLTSNS